MPSPVAFRTRPEGSIHVFPVHVSEQPLAPEVMQELAREAGGDVAFVADLVPSDASMEAAVRWFSPAAEIHLCGLGALAAAAALCDAVPPPRRGTLRTPRGPLPFRVEGARLDVRLPAFRPRAWTPPPALLAALGLDAVTRTRHAPDLETAVLEVATPDVLQALRPDFSALATVRAPGLGAVVVTAAAPPTAPHDAAFRYFAPWYGKDESPQAASAASVLAPFWPGRGDAPLALHQASSRPLDLWARPDGDGVWLRAWPLG